MTNNKKSIFVLILFLIISCNSLKTENIKGEYNYKSKISSGKIILYNNTFIYNYEAPLDFYSSKGQWEVKNNTIILNSDIEYKSDYLQVEEKTNNKEKYIQIFDINNNPTLNVGIQLNQDSQEYITDINGKIYLNELTKINEIKINDIGISENNNTYKVKSNTSSVFLIKLIPKDFTKKFFENTSIKIKKNQLIIDNQEYIKK